MTTRPHDVNDLYLAPLALDIDRRLEELSGFSVEEVQFRMMLGTDLEPETAAEREAALLQTLTSDLELHGWRVSRHPRGVLLSHEFHSLVLGLPSNLIAYLDA